jgi:hypothetical protein
MCALFILVAFAAGMLAASYGGKRTVEVVQVGKGYSIACKEERNPYPYFEGVAISAEQAAGAVLECLTMKIKTEWGK